MRVAVVLLVVAVCAYLVVRVLQRRLGASADGHGTRPVRDPAAEEAYRRAVRERADRQRRGLPEPAPEPPRSLVEIDDDVFECNDHTDSMAEYFVVSSTARTREVVAAVDRAGARFMRVDENGVEHPDDAAAAAARFELYTPNYVAVPEVTRHGVNGYVDCKGVIPPEMGTRFRLILREELETLGAASHVATQDP